VGLVAETVNPETLESEFETALDRTLAGGGDPLEAVEEVRDEFMLAWDDDGGGGLAAALEYEIPADGNYRLVVAGALSTLGGQTFGNSQLLIGLDAPQVLSGEAEPTADTIAVLDVEATPPGVGVQELTGTLTPEKTSTLVTLHDFRPGDTLYAYVEANSDKLRPTLVLKNFAQKPIRSANLDGKDTRGKLQYTFPREGRNYQLEIAACCEEEQVTIGDYRLLVGVNTPEVLTGIAAVEGRAVVREPIEVKIGVRMEQIVEMDQQAEFFTAVASLQLEWTDPALAFNPETCHCDFLTFSGNDFNQYVAETKARWPEFTIQNQQGNRWTQNRDVVLFADGRAIYFERFTTNFQVDFDFRQFPFDDEEFVIRVDSLFPDEFYVYDELAEFSQISSGHGEDEFILEEFETSLTREPASNGSGASRFTFTVSGPRHLGYYIFRIFVPILLIIVVSWITFFLKDYGRRIEIASANLLLFIALSFSLADNYPRLGYLTFLDAIMAIMFVVNALVVVYNVWLKRLEMNEKADLAERIDNVLDWAYPLIYIVAFGMVILLYFGVSPNITPPA
jgi:hypothetical protein